MNDGRVTTTIPKNEKEILRQKARSYGLTMSAYVRLILRKYEKEDLTK